MIDKEIINDYVNLKVQECDFWQEGHCNSGDTLDGYPHCLDFPNCYYKQLQRKEQECEELKHNYDAIKQCNDSNMQTLNEAIKEKREAEQKLEKVEKQYKCYSCGTCNGKEDYYNLAGHHENAIKSLHKERKRLDCYKQALEKIEEYCKHNKYIGWVDVEGIMDIINKVKD